MCAFIHSFIRCVLTVREAGEEAASGKFAATGGWVAVDRPNGE